MHFLLSAYHATFHCHLLVTYGVEVWDTLLVVTTFWSCRRREYVFFLQVWRDHCRPISLQLRVLTYMSSFTTFTTPVISRMLIYPTVGEAKRRQLSSHGCEDALTLSLQAWELWNSVSLRTSWLREKSFSPCLSNLRQTRERERELDSIYPAILQKYCK